MEAEVAAEDLVAEQASVHATAEGFPDASDGQGVFGADVEHALACSDRPGGDGHAFDNAVGATFQQHAVHERTRIAFVAIADDVLQIPRGLADLAPFNSRGEAGSAAPAQAALANLPDQLFGRQVTEGLFEGFESVVAEILVQVGRGRMGDPFGGDVNLVPQEGTRGALLHIEGVGGNRITKFVAQEAIEKTDGRLASPLQEAFRFEMPKNNFLSLASGDL